MSLDESVLDRIEEIENLWIPMPDGCRLAARAWLPDGARAAPVPAILEYIPYRKRDLMRHRDEPIHRYFALNGYASLRVDIRGSGDSEGTLDDEYSPQEHADALEIIAWIAAQPWCSGSVGMVGISWGGFNALQVAALRPPALKAIITLCASDDRYADDAHYMGGCLINENMQWGTSLTASTALPPDPETVGDAWRHMWRARLDALKPFPGEWMRHQWRDEYWKHGSVNEDFGAIACPVYAIGGWADGYSNSVPRLLAGLKAPVKGLVGPWAHIFPHNGIPGPAIGYLQEAVRWWDHWLKGRDTGLMDEPAYRVWLQESIPPQPQYAEWPGRWVAEDTWPSARIRPRALVLNVGHLAASADEPTVVSFSSPQTTGQRSGEWCGFASDGDMPADQRPDDGGSLTFDSDPLATRIEILGAPAVILDIKVDRPVALLCARLCTVAPDGSVLRVSYGLLNLTHRDSHETPEHLEPGRWYRIRLQMNDVAHAFPEGHRIRVALSTSYWPIAWPSPAPAIVTMRTGTSTLELPIRDPRPEDAALRPFEPPEWAPGSNRKWLKRLPFRRSVEIDLTTSEMVYTLRSDGGELGGVSLARMEEIDLEVGSSMLRRFRIIESDPLSAQTECTIATSLRRGDWSVKVECRTRLASTADMFQFACEVVAWEGDALFARKDWTLAIPRMMV